MIDPTQTEEKAVNVNVKTAVPRPIIRPADPGEAVPPPGAPSEPIMPQAAESGNLEGAWNRVIHGLIYAVTFLLPILFTPWTLEPLEFSKQMLLFILVSAGLIAWLLKLLVLRSWKFVKTPLDLPIAIFLLIYLLASIFSVDRVASFLGFYGSFSGNFFEILFLVIFYYLVVNNFQTLKQAKTLFSVFFFSALVSLAYIVLQFFGVYVVHFPFAKATSFNTIGGILTISLFASLVAVLSMGFRSGSGTWFGFDGGKLWRILAVVFAFLIVLTVNFVYAWAGMLVGILLFLVFQVALSRSLSVRNFIMPLVLFILVTSFLVIQFVFADFLQIRNVFNLKLPVEVRLDYTTAQPVLVGVVSEKPILGLGPNTFLYAFSKHRAENFNLTPFWNMRFDKAPSEAAEYLVGTGILGVLAFEILSLIFIAYGLSFLIRKKDEEGSRQALVVYAGFAVLWFAHWFFPFNTVIAFSYWLLLALFVLITRIVGGERVKTASFSLASSPRQTVSVVSAVSLGLVLVIVFLFFASAIYASDIYYTKGVKASGNPDNYDQVQYDLEQAIRLNRFRPDYYLSYGEFLFIRINQELTKSEPNLGQIQSWLAAGINTSRAAVNLSPANWTAWERLANLYTSARPLVAGVDNFIIDSLTQAVERDDKNPILLTELGQVYRLASQKLDPSILGKGVDSDSDGLSDEQEQALGSDPEDSDTNGNRVLDGNEVLSGLNPAGSGALANDFLSQYIKTDAEYLIKAEDAFRKAITLKGDYAAAYYHLALTLQQEQKLDEAVAVMEQILQQYPTNIDIKFQLGIMYYNSGKVEQAARQFQEIVSLMPSHANARFSLALSYERLGKLQRALDEYRKVLETNLDNEGLKQKVQQLSEQLASPPAAR